MTTPPDPTTGRPARLINDDVAYVLPMAVFLTGVWAGGHWPQVYVAAYAARAAAAAAALVLLRSHYTRVSWSYWWVGAIVGVVGVVQWVGMQAVLERHVAFFRPDADAVYDPTAHFTGASLAAFVALRLAGAAVVVPVMEELFWRDWLWRTILAPNDFKLAAVGEAAWQPVVIVTAAFCSVHGLWFPTAIVWGGMIAALLVCTRSLGACIVAHGTTNLLLGLYVLRTHHWSLW